MMHPLIVGVTGFEPATTWSQTRCATGLRYAPIASGKNTVFLHLRCKVNGFSCIVQEFLKKIISNYIFFQVSLVKRI